MHSQKRIVVLQSSNIVLLKLFSHMTMKHQATDARVYEYYTDVEPLLQVCWQGRYRYEIGKHFRKPD